MNAFLWSTCFSSLTQSYFNHNKKPAWPIKVSRLDLFLTWPTCNQFWPGLDSSITEECGYALPIDRFIWADWSFSFWSPVGFDLGNLLVNKFSKVHRIINFMFVWTCFIKTFDQQRLSNFLKTSIRYVTCTLR